MKAPKPGSAAYAQLHRKLYAARRRRERLALEVAAADKVVRVVEKALKGKRPGEGC